MKDVKGGYTMVTVGSVNGKEVKGMTEFYLDDASDVKDLPTGSTAICMATAQVVVKSGLNYKI